MAVEKTNGSIKLDEVSKRHLMFYGECTPFFNDIVQPSNGREGVLNIGASNN